MIIKDHAKYLGFQTGPKSGEHQWTEALKKFAERTNDLKVLNLPLRLAINRFNFKIVPVLGYIAQLALPPPNIIRFELTAILKALGFAGNSMTCHTAYTIDGLLGFSPVRPSVYMESCMIRGAVKTFVNIEEMQSELCCTAENSLALSSAYRNIIPPGWDSPAFCTNISNASKVSGLRHASMQSNGISSAISLWKLGGVKGSLQKLVSNTLHKNISMDTSLWVTIIQEKLEILAPGQDILFSEQMLSDLFTVVRKAPPPRANLLPENCDQLLGNIV